MNLVKKSQLIQKEVSKVLVLQGYKLVFQMQLSDKDIDRYSRNIILPEIGEKASINFYNLKF